MNIQDWFSLGLTCLIPSQSKGLSRVFSNNTVWKPQFFGTRPSLDPTLISIHDYWKSHTFDYTDLCYQNNGSHEPCCVGPPKMGGSWWRVLTKCGPLEKGMGNHSSILALITPWTVWKGKTIWKETPLNALRCTGRAHSIHLFQLVNDIERQRNPGVNSRY